MTAPRVLTFNFHEPYLCLMAKTGLPLTVGLYDKKAFARTWQTKFRPVPPNVTFVPESEWRRDLEQGRYDVVVAHNELNAADLFSTKTPGLLVCHNRRSYLKTTVQGDPAELDRLLARLQDRFEFVFISESKRADYGLPGRVIPPGIDVDEYGGYTGEIVEILRVGNAMRARNLMFDVDLQERVCEGLPNRLVGEDPLIPHAKPSASFEDLLDKFRTLRCLFHVTCQDWEDGYNLSTLEAMACGMPVVALANRTSPITDMVDGFVSGDEAMLRRRLEDLLRDQELAQRLGERGRDTVARKFPISVFAERWREAIEEAAERSPRASKPAAPHPPRLNVLLEYVASPITTARYFEEALRRRHRVTTAGLRCPEGVLTGWGFREPVPPYAPHDIDLPLNSTYSDLQGRLNGDAPPQIHLWVDSGVKHVAPDIACLPQVKACYLIDTHVDLQSRLEVAKHFDFVFMAQKAQLPAFLNAGMNAHWLPLACSRDLHAVPPRERTFDVAYVGSLSDTVDRRRKLLESIAQRFPNSRIGRFWPHEMADIYSRAKIVFNACVNRDVNMRVFEGLASGALVITDEADGLEELFEDRKHLIIYRNDDEAFELIEQYLRDDDARERIAAEGRREVMARHTYDHRTETLLQTVADASGGQSGESRFHAGGYYRCPRPELLVQVPVGAKRVLDVGCGAGEFGRAIKRRGAQEVAGIEIVERAWELAKHALDTALLGNIEQMDLTFDDNHFDCICFGDVLEHLVDPAAVLRKVSRVLAPSGVVVMSIPNVRFCHVVQMLAHGRWKYEDAGILDRTHLRFFTATDMAEMVREAGLEVLKLQPLSMLTPDKLPRSHDGSVTMGRLTLRGVTEDEYRDLLTYQYLVVAGKPGVHRLEAARKALEEGDNESAYTLAEEAASGADEFERKRIMAKAIARLGKLDTAERLYREALAARYDTATAGELGVVLVAMRRHDAAKTLLLKVLEEDPEDERAVAGLGLIDIAEEKPESAIDRFERALDLNLNNPNILGHLIAAGAALGRHAEVEPYVRRFVEFYPGNIEMLCQYVELLRILGRHAEAEDRLETALLLNPGHPAVEALRASAEG